MDFVFTKYAKKQWDQLDPPTQAELKKKLITIKAEPTLLTGNLKKVWDLLPATHRLRIGHFRLLLECDFERGIHLVLKVGHRREIYK